MQSKEGEVGWVGEVVRGRVRHLPKQLVESGGAEEEKEEEELMCAQILFKLQKKIFKEVEKKMSALRVWCFVYQTGWESARQETYTVGGQREPAISERSIF